MAVPRDENGKVLPHTAIPNGVLRSKHLSVYDKLIFAVLRSCRPAYPSYKKLQEWTGLSTDRIWKSLKTLEERRLIVRFKRGRAVEYISYWDLPDDGAVVARRKMFPPDGKVRDDVSA